MQSSWGTTEKCMGNLTPVCPHYIFMYATAQLFQFSSAMFSQLLKVLNIYFKLGLAFWKLFYTNLFYKHLKTFFEKPSYISSIWK